MRPRHATPCGAGCGVVSMGHGDRRRTSAGSLVIMTGCIALGAIYKPERILSSQKNIMKKNTIITEYYYTMIRHYDGARLMAPAMSTIGYFFSNILYNIAYMWAAEVPTTQQPPSTDYIVMA